MWTPTALRSELVAYSGRAWRIVEAQHRISTNRLAESRADQLILESLVEEVKPKLPSAAAGLDYLLASPFRYGHKVASRFRNPAVREGVLYAAEHEATALAETAYWRLRFFRRSPGAPPPRTTTEFSAFTFDVQAPRALDLTAAPLVQDRAVWTDPNDYGGCQTLAEAARAAAVQAIRYESVRDPRARANLAVLDAGAVAHGKPRPARTWHLRIEHDRLTALAAFPSSEQHAFTPAQFGLTSGA